ncbi:MAG: hypothetical protein II821_07955 [Treponema sp.]|nr:hypothetical protein [Treponema sp.]
MKKLLALAAAAVLSVTAAFAENQIHLGLAIPVQSLTIEYPLKDLDCSVAGCDFAFDYTHIARSGFTFKVGFDSGYISTTSDDFSKDYSGSNFAFGFGFGGSVIHDDRFTLSVLGSFGLDLFTVDPENSAIDDGLGILFYIGPEVTFTFKFADHVGIFADLPLLYAAGTFYPPTLSSDTTDSYTMAGVIVKPRLGVTFAF